MYWQPSELFGSDVYFVLFFSGRQKIASFSVTDLNTIRDVHAPAERSGKPSQSINTHTHTSLVICQSLVSSLWVSAWFCNCDKMALWCGWERLCNYTCPGCKWSAALRSDPRPPGFSYSPSLMLMWWNGHQFNNRRSLPRLKFFVKSHKATISVNTQLWRINCVCVVCNVCVVFRRGGAEVTGCVEAAYLGSTSWGDSYSWVITCVCVCAGVPYQGAYGTMEGCKCSETPHFTSHLHTHTHTSTHTYSFYVCVSHQVCKSSLRKKLRAIM